MGFYIETPMPYDKVTQMRDLYDAVPVPLKAATAYLSDPARTVLCVVQNPTFDAVLIVTDKEEFIRSLPRPDDLRPRTWMVISRDTARRLNPYAFNEGD